MKKFVLGLLVGLGFVTAVGVAQSAFYVGYNPLTGLNGTPGIPVAVGTQPVLTTGTSCGTTSQVGGAGTFQVTAGAVSCTLVVQIPAAAPNGVFCVASDETTPADTMKQTAHTATTCTLTGTVVAADKIIIEVNGY